MTAQGHPRHFERAQATSGLHPTPEVSLRNGEPTFRATSGHRTHSILIGQRELFSSDFAPIKA